MQAAHVAAVAAAHGGEAGTAWEHRTIILHAASAGELATFVAAAPGGPGVAGHRCGVTWFIEPDRWFELTAVAFDACAVPCTCPSAPTAPLEPLPLWTPPAATATSPGRDEVRAILSALDRRGLTGADVVEFAAELGDACDPLVRRRAAWLLARDREPPMA